MVPEPGGPGGPLAPPIFCRSVNPIQTGEGRLSPSITTGHPNVFHLPAALIQWVLCNQCWISLNIIYNLLSIFIIQGIAILFDRSGGKLTETMADKIAISKSNNAQAELLIKEVRKRWDTWDLQESTGNSVRSTHALSICTWFLKMKFKKSSPTNWIFNHQKSI